MDSELLEKLTPRQVWALTAWGESRSLDNQGTLAVILTVPNRVAKDSWWGKTIKAVCLHESQYSCWWPFGGLSNYQLLEQMAGSVIRTPEAQLPYSILRCFTLVDLVEQGLIRDFINGATHYYHKSIKAPAWTKPPAVFVAEYGGHLFYRGVK
jgi:N-acetylmuramoyl-L-alanine amidase